MLKNSNYSHYEKKRKRLKIQNIKDISFSYPYHTDKSLCSTQYFKQLNYAELNVIVKN